MHSLDFRLDERHDSFDESVRLVPAARRKNIEAEKHVAEVWIIVTRGINIVGYIVVNVVAGARHQQHSLKPEGAEFYIGQRALAQVAAQQRLRPQRLDVSDELE